MNITNEKEVMIFKREYNGKPYYSLGLSKKNQDGSYTNGYITCQFKNGVNLANQTKIKIKSAWLSFYLKDKQTIPYIFINDFATNAEVEVNNGIDVYEQFGTTVTAEQLDENMDLPF